MTEDGAVARLAGSTAAGGFAPALSARTAHLREASLLRSLTERVGAFPDGVNLGQGICELEVPRVLREAAAEAARSGRAGYTPFAGLEELRRAIARRMERRYGLAYDADDVVVTVGASAALFASFLALIDPGDEVVLFEPFYPYHYTGARLAGARVVTVPLAAGATALDGRALAAAVGPRTRVVLLNTPANPLGRVWTEAELDLVAEVLAPSRAVLVTDEIYEDLVYDGRHHVPPATRPGLRDRTVTISGVGKAYSVTGWRLGWLAAPPALVRAIGPVFDVLCACAPRPLQQAAARALEEIPESYYAALRGGYERRRDRLARALRGAGFRPFEPAGAYYMLADYRDRYGTLETREACFRLLDEIHVATIPGEIFFSGEPPPVLRFHFAVEDALLEEVAGRLERSRA